MWARQRSPFVRMSVYPGRYRITCAVREVTEEVVVKKRILTLLVVMAFVVLMAAPVALAHGGADDGHDEQIWLKTGLVAGGVVVFGGGAFFALKRR